MGGVSLVPFYSKIAGSVWFILTAAKNEKDLQRARSLAGTCGEELLDFLGGRRGDAHRIIGENQGKAVRTFGNDRFAWFGSWRSLSGEGLGDLFFGLLGKRLGEIHAKGAFRLHGHGARIHA